MSDEASIKKEEVKKEEDVPMDEAAAAEAPNGQEQPDEEMEEDARDPEKIVKLPGGTDGETAATFQIKDEDHTLGNSLRYVIMKNPDVEFCGYSIPHPSEAKLNIRVQTYGQMTASQALQKGLNDLINMCDHIEEVFRSKVEAGGYRNDDDL